MHRPRTKAQLQALLQREDADMETLRKQALIAGKFGAKGLRLVNKL